VKFLVEGVVKIAHVDDPVLVPGEELLKPAQDLPVVVAERQSLLLRDLQRALARPARRRMRKPRIGNALDARDLFLNVRHFPSSEYDRGSAEYRPERRSCQD
jgi:hypothetical protein